MSDLSVFDIIGPIMVGPSSSHTAGAVRIGNLAQEIVRKEFNEVKIYLHGSFKETYRGHGTDKALIGGLLGLSTEDSLIKKSFGIAKKKGIEFEFLPINLGEVHPNTVKLKIRDIESKVTTIIASSIGGGSVIVTEIDGIEVDLTGEYCTLITHHWDKPGVIAKIDIILQTFDLNIAVMKLVRQSKGSLATAIIELDQSIEDSVLALIKEIPEIESSRVINPIEYGEDIDV